MTTICGCGEVAHPEPSSGDLTGQKVAAERANAQVTEKRPWPGPPVTQLVPLATFYPAESYHRDYFEQNPRQRYCQIVIAPKVAKFRKEYLARLKG